jgi:hypothetical protein
MGEGEPKIESPEERFKKKDWEDRYERAKGIKGDIFKELDRINKNDDDLYDQYKGIEREFHRMATEAGFTDEILRKYGAYHVFIVSTTSFKDTPEFDFPEKYGFSIVRFLETTLEQLRQQESKSGEEKVK